MKQNTKKEGEQVFSIMMTLLALGFLGFLLGSYFFQPITIESNITKELNKTIYVGETFVGQTEMYVAKQMISKQMNCEELSLAKITQKAEIDTSFSLREEVLCCTGGVYGTVNGERAYNHCGKNNCNSPEIITAYQVGMKFYTNKNDLPSLSKIKPENTTTIIKEKLNREYYVVLDAEQRLIKGNLNEPEFNQKEFVLEINRTKAESQIKTDINVFEKIEGTVKFDETDKEYVCVPRDYNNLVIDLRKILR